MAAKYDQWLTEEGLLRIQGWARDGLTDKDIAKNMAVGLSTLREWKNRFEQIKGALSIGKDAADRVVENALYKSACGYTETIRKPMRIKTIEYDPETGKKVREVEKVVAVEEQIHFPAQVTAPSADDKEDDGFLDALKESAREDWGGSDAAGGV